MKRESRISETECAEFPCIRVRCIPLASRSRTAPVHVLTHGAHHSRTRAIRTARTPVPSRAHVLPYRVSGETPEPCATDSVRASLRGEHARSRTPAPLPRSVRSRACSRAPAPRCSHALTCAHSCRSHPLHSHSSHTQPFTSQSDIATHTAHCEDVRETRARCAEHHVSAGQTPCRCKFRHLGHPL